MLWWVFGLGHRVVALNVAFQLVIWNLIEKQVDFLKRGHGLFFVKLQLLLDILKQKLIPFIWLILFGTFSTTFIQFKSEWWLLAITWLFCVILKTHLLLAFKWLFILLLMHLSVNRPHFLSDRFWRLDFLFSILLYRDFDFVHYFLEVGQIFG